MAGKHFTKSRTRKLAFECLEDRSVPAVLATHAVAAPLPPPPPPPNTIGVPIGLMATAGNAAPVPSTLAGKLAVNHNETFVRDRRRTRRRR